jgi:hypothetical protein
MRLAEVYHGTRPCRPTISAGLPRARPRADSSVPVEETVLEGLGEMLGTDLVLASQVGDGAGHLEQAVMGAGRQPEAIDGPPHQGAPVRRQWAVPRDLPGCHARVHPHARPAEAQVLALARRQDAPADRRGILPRRRGPQLAVRDRWDLEVQIDPVEQRARQPPEVAAPLAGRALAALRRQAPAAARIGRRDELELGRKADGARRPAEGDGRVFERLPQGLQDVLGELRNLVQKRDATLQLKFS